MWLVFLDHILSGFTLYPFVNCAVLAICGMFIQRKVFFFLLPLGTSVDFCRVFGGSIPGFLGGILYCWGPGTNPSL